MVLWTAFLVGLFGSMHCVGMCAPLALAMPVGNAGKGRFLLSRLLYNSGRIVTYVLLGVMFGLLGEGFSLAGLQQYLSIGAGVVLLLAVLSPVLGWQTNKVFAPFYRFNSFLKQRFAALFKKKSLAASFYLGLFNGLLPCGLVYVALAGAMAQGHWQYSILYMALFGLGTLPLMLAASLAGNVLSPFIKGRFQKIIPYLLVLMGCLFILRGLNLGIPYVSPQLQYEAGVKVTTCQ